MTLQTLREPYLIDGHDERPRVRQTLPRWPDVGSHIFGAAAGPGASRMIAVERERRELRAAAAGSVF